MKQLNKILSLNGIVIWLLMIPFLSVRAQDINGYGLDLQDVVSLAVEQSSAVKYAQNRNENYYWRWKNFKTQYRPQLVVWNLSRLQTWPHRRGFHSTNPSLLQELMFTPLLPHTGFRITTRTLFVSPEVRFRSVLPNLFFRLTG